MAAKWLGKRSQAVTERLNKDARRTEEDAEFQELSMQSDATQKAVVKIVERVPCYLHPNAAARAKAVVGTTMAKMRKTAAEKRYPHASGELANTLLRAADELPPDSAFGQGLRAVGDTFNAICEVEHDLDAEVQQNLLSPMREMMEGEFKSLAKLRKKLNGRRLDLDYKQRKLESGKSTVTQEDIRQARDKYEASKNDMENAMMNLLDSDMEQVGQLSAFIAASLTATRKILDNLSEAQSSINEILSEAESRPKREARPVSTYNYDDDDDDYDDDAAAAADDGTGPRALATFDFEAESEGELSFKSGQMIRLISRLDENWLEGEVDGVVGIFPTNYVEVVEDL